ncbi:MAG: nitrous oxide reductase accessory protein NosL [Cytophagales bacterium]|nr:nitrous oxide reductase accessory protein NosL [Bernardetiaceae bacterium]MDW8211331.1 nitrous oxide reductase accessory protein NosL [Cytophagales bacterium]
MKSVVYYLAAAVLLIFSAACSENPSENTRCAQCGMPSEKYPQWRGKIVTASQVKYFCSPKCLFIHSHAHAPALADSIWLTDYYQQHWIDARKAYYVMGSDIIGPMGPDFVPLSTLQEAQDFMKEHQGKQIFTFTEITPETIKQLNEASH